MLSVNLATYALSPSGFALYQTVRGFAQDMPFILTLGFIFYAVKPCTRANELMLGHDAGQGPRVKPLIS